MHEVYDLLDEAVDMLPDDAPCDMDRLTTTSLLFDGDPDNRAADPGTGRKVNFEGLVYFQPLFFLRLPAGSDRPQWEECMVWRELENSWVVLFPFYTDEECAADPGAQRFVTITANSLDARVFFFFFFFLLTPEGVVAA